MKKTLLKLGPTLKSQIDNNETKIEGSILDWVDKIQKPNSLGFKPDKDGLFSNKHKRTQIQLLRHPDY